MTSELTLEQVATRLYTLEERVALLSNKLSHSHIAQPLPFQYVLFVNDEEVWSGTDLKKKITQILERDPKAEITIGWRTEEPYVHL